MYLSRLSISNYRSIKELNLTFSKGKNVIVGKNNAGKSCIIRAIDILLGESSPTYQKTENVTENDFYQNNISEPILIYCELSRDDDEELNYNEIYNCFGYYVHTKDYQKVRYALKDSNFWNDLHKVFDCRDGEADKRWINPKKRLERTMENEFGDKFHYAFAFCAELDLKGNMQKDIRFLYRENKNEDWIMAFKAPIRNELLQSAIIPSFRDPQNQLRLSQWSWYGKLLKKSINANDKQLQRAFCRVRAASNKVFKELKDDINNSRIKVAFPQTEINFQFNPESKQDIYKSSLIYVNDGYNSQLSEKGSGIQSTVIIGLFDYYCRQIAHCSCSLLAIEEPELYLHPQARRVISNRLDDFLDGGKNQVIITTHSTEFLTSAHDDINVIVVTKSNENGTQAKNAQFSKTSDRQILIKAQNTEMFFADAVILVEGGDKYVLEAVAQQYGQDVQGLGVNWVNDRNLSIIAVGGKSEFCKYFKKLHEVNIPCFVLSDFDFFLRGFGEFLTKTSQPEPIRNRLNAVKGQIGTTETEIAIELQNCIDTTVTQMNALGAQINAHELKKSIKQSFRIKKLSQVDIQHHQTINKFLNDMRQDINIFMLPGELEDTFTNACLSGLNGINGKEERPIHIVSELKSDTVSITDLIKCEQYYDFLDMVCQRLGFPNRQTQNVEPTATQETVVAPV